MAHKIKQSIIPVYKPGPNIAVSYRTYIANAHLPLQKIMSLPTMHFITRVCRFFDNNFVTLSWIAIRF